TRGRTRLRGRRAEDDGRVRVPRQRDLLQPGVSSGPDRPQGVSPGPGRRQPEGQQAERGGRVRPGGGGALPGAAVGRVQLRLLQPELAGPGPVHEAGQRRRQGPQPLPVPHAAGPAAAAPVDQAAAAGHHQDRGEAGPGGELGERLGAQADVSGGPAAALPRPPPPVQEAAPSERNAAGLLPRLPG
ncbi:unnamed protein product, partial [Tetraodon nigroviridis]